MSKNENGMERENLHEVKEIRILPISYWKTSAIVGIYREFIESVAPMRGIRHMVVSNLYYTPIHPGMGVVGQHIDRCITKSC